GLARRAGGRDRRGAASAALTLLDLALEPCEHQAIAVDPQVDLDPRAGAAVARHPEADGQERVAGETAGVAKPHPPDRRAEVETRRRALAALELAIRPSGPV